MSKKYTYEEVKNYVNSLGYEYVSEEYINNRIPLKLKDKSGYLYTAYLNDLKRGFRPNFVDKHNSFSIYNIKLWCKLNNIDLTLLSDIYEGNQKKLIFIDSNNYKYAISWHSLQSGCKPLKFHKSNPYALSNLELWIKENNKPYILIDKTYNYSGMKFKCINCKEEFNMSLELILRNQNCPFCAGKRVGLSNCLVIKNPELAKEWHPTKNGELTPFDVTCCSGKYVWWQCSKNPKHEWLARIADRNNGRWCPECNNSKGEERIRKWLENNKFDFILQKEFNGLVGLGGGNLSYDFYLPKYNFLIEYQGEFHDGSSGEYAKINLKRQQEHDRRKREYAQNHNIKLLEIWYWDYDNIESILQKELNLQEVVSIA